MMRRVILGVTLGCALFLLFGSAASGQLWNPGLAGLGLLAAFMVLMTTVCMLACLAPTLRALRIQPTEALSADS